MVREEQEQIFGLTHGEERTLRHAQRLQQSLQWKDGQPPNLHEIRNALGSFTLNIQPYAFFGEIRKPPDMEEFAENMVQVCTAFALVAYPYMDKSGQMGVQSSYGYRSGFGKKDGDLLTITPRQKQMLSLLTTAAGIPDNPDQLTYPFSIISTLQPTLPRNEQAKPRG